jgi:hypothetical protein
VVAKAMEDSVNDGVYRSDNDASYTRPFVTELSTASSSGDRRVLQPVNTTDLSNATMVDGLPMAEKRYKDIYNLVIQKCAIHLLPCDTCPVCKAFMSEKNRIKATQQELTKRPCTEHKDEVSSTCRECLLWSAHGGDLRAEKVIDYSAMEPDSRDLCRYLSEHIYFLKMTQNTDNLDNDWLAAMTKEEERAVHNLTFVSDAYCNKQSFLRCSFEKDDG